MKKHKIYIIVLIIITLVSTLYPGFVKEDITKDNYVDLKDAVSQVKNLAEKAEQSGTIAGQFTNTLSTLKIVAGIKTIINKTKNNKNISDGQSGFYILSAKNKLPSLNYITQIESIDADFSSMEIIPASPPPQFNS